MTSSLRESLLQLLVHPEAEASLSAASWDGVVRVARCAGVLGRLGVRLQEHGAPVPPAPRRHMEAAVRAADVQPAQTRWEVRRIREALGSAGVEFMLLKGAAYVLGDLPPARGRRFADVDILVPHAELARSESALRIHGWISGHSHPYDQRYYRQWMHELPPMRHLRRGGTLDVHHALLPLTAPLQPDSDLLWGARRPVPDWSGVSLPAPTDLVLHAAAHLFQDGALEDGLRDLLDLDDLLRHFGSDVSFWNALLARADAMDLALPLRDALHWTHELLETPVPAGAVDGWAGTRRPRWRQAVIDRLFARALWPDHPLVRARGDNLARGALYLRAHVLRMPIGMVTGHLARKALRPRVQTE